MGKKSRKQRNPNHRQTAVSACGEMLPGWAHAVLNGMLTDAAVRRGVTVVDDALVYQDQGSGIYFIAVGLEDPDAVRLQVGVWAARNPMDIDTIAAVNDVACDYSNYKRIPDMTPVAVMCDLPAARAVLQAYETRLGMR